MGAAGVTCLDCHDPHTAKLKLPQEDNSLCLRCHADGTPVNQLDLFMNTEKECRRWGRKRNVTVLVKLG